jgi:hypothetical protein
LPSFRPCNLARHLWLHTSRDVFLGRDLEIRFEFLPLLGIGLVSAEKSPPVHALLSSERFNWIYGCCP